MELTIILLQFFFSSPDFNERKIQTENSNQMEKQQEVEAFTNRSGS